MIVVPRRTGVKPAPFAYAKAKSIEHAITLLGEPDARLIAGGQSLMATLNMRLSTPKLLVDINGLDLAGVNLKADSVEIGALTRHVQAERSADIAKHAPLIALAMPHIGLGGSIAFADPAAELPACLLALAGEVAIASPNGKRSVKADEFFKGLFETALGPQDVLTAIRVPAAGKDTRVGFAEFSRRHGDYAMVGLAACARADGKGLADVRLAFFGVGTVPLRAGKAEAALAGGRIDDAVQALDTDLAPSDDVQATAATKRHLAGVLLRRVAKQLTEPRP
jgi:carbon-monoxide dehydrogenase medium subunit